MATPKERLQEAAHRLAGSAENLEELLCPAPAQFTPYAPAGSLGDPRDNHPSDLLPTKIKEGIKEVRKFADEIEEITK